MRSQELPGGRRKRWLFAAACLCAAAGPGLDRPAALAQDMTGPAPAGKPPAENPQKSQDPTQAQETYQRAFSIIPHIGVSETYTDNVDLSPDNHRSDFITRGWLGFEADLNHGPATAKVNGEAAYDYYARTSDLRGWTFSALGSAAYVLVPDLLSIEGDGSLTNQYTSVFNASAVDRSGTPGRTQVGVYSLGPKLTARIADTLDLKGEARFGQVLYSAADNSPVIGQLPDDDNFAQAGLRLDTGEHNRPWELVTNAQFSGDKHGYRFGSGVQSVYFRVAPMWRLLVRAGYERVHQSGIVDISAPLVTAGVEFTPNDASQITVEAGTRYDRSAVAARADVRVSQRLYVVGTYSESVTPDQLYVADAFEQFRTDAALLPPAPASQPFNLGENLYNQTSYNKRGDLRLVYQGPIQKIEVGGLWSDRNFLVNNTHDRTASGLIDYSRHLWPDLDFEASVNYTHVFASPTFGASENWIVLTTLTYLVNSTTDLRGGYSYKRGEEQFFGGQTIAENAVFISLQKRF